jgi:hypothetical protein
MIFAKNQEVYYLALKCKTTPVASKSTGTCAKLKKIPPKAVVTK